MTAPIDDIAATVAQLSSAMDRLETMGERMGGVTAQQIENALCQLQHALDLLKEKKTAEPGSVVGIRGSV